MKSSHAWPGIVLAAALSAALPATAQTLNHDLAGIGFLIGHWSNGEGRVADTGGTSKGQSTVTVEAGGGALLRRDHTDLFDAKGKPSGGFDQIMLIYPEAGTIRADYSDGQHVIHYTSATVLPGKSVTFTNAAGGGPVFRLSYDLQSVDTLSIAFAMQPPGGTAFTPIAAGTLKKAP